MKPSFRYTVYQHGYELKHLHGTIEAIDGAQVEVVNTLKEQSLIKFLAEMIRIKVATDFPDQELNEKAKQSVLQTTMLSFVKHFEYRVHAIDNDHGEEAEVFICNGEFLKKLMKAVGL